jgi:hypothetical protein
MSLQWFRFYADALNDPKVQRLSGPTFKNWVNCLCLAAKGGGVLPAMPDIAFALRMSEPDAMSTVAELQTAGLLDQTGAGLVPHNWAKRQYQSDTSAERTRRYRERKRHGDVTVTPPEQNRADSEQNIPESRTAPTLENILDWQAFCLWAVGGLRHSRDAVLGEIEERAPGFLEWEAERWNAELDRGRRCDFYADFVPALVAHGLPLPTAQTKPIMQAALSDPRQDRMQAYLRRCTENPTLCNPWPNFEMWRTSAWAA